MGFFIVYEISIAPHELILGFNNEFLQLADKTKQPFCSPKRRKFNNNQTAFARDLNGTKKSPAIAVSQHTVHIRKYLIASLRAQQMD